MRNNKKNNDSLFLDERTPENKNKKNAVKRKKVKKSAQDTIPFDEVLEHSTSDGFGLIRKGGKYTLVFAFDNLDYRMYRDDEQEQVYNKYQQLLNALPSECQYQELIINSQFDLETLRRALLPTEKKYELFNDYYDIMNDRLEKAHNVSCKKILVGAISYQPQGRLDSPDTLDKYFNEIKSALENLKVNAVRLKPEEVFRIMHELYHPFSSEDFLMPEDFYRSDINLKDYISPSVFVFKAKQIEMGSAYSRCLFVKRFSRDVDDYFITDIMDNPYRIAVSKQIRRIDKSESMALLKRQFDDLEGKMEKRRELNHKRGTSYMPYKYTNREDELKRIQSKLGGSNCDLFEVGIFILISAETIEELEELTVHIKNQARKHQVIIDTLIRQQENGLNTILPMATNHFSESSGNNCNWFFLTDEVANFIPFSFTNYFSPGGLYYGTNIQTKNPIVIDRTEEMNANGFTMGSSGSGKSMFTKAEFFAARFKYPEDEFIVIDPENEYRLFLEPFDGTLIKLSPSSDTYVNLFDTDLSYVEEGSNAIALKTDFIMTFVETAKGSPLTAQERSVIDRCVKLVYATYQKSQDKKDIPTLSDFYNALINQKTPVANDVALIIELYVHGTFDNFAHKTNVNWGKKFLVFDIFEMGEQLRTVGLQILLEIIWQRVIDNKKRGVRTWLWCDEFSVMFQNESSGNFFLKVYQRIRKHGGVATGITQNISQVAENKEASLMLQNAEFVVLLQQKKDDLDKVIDMFNLSEGQYSYLKTGNKGTGLIVCGQKVIPFDNTIPKGSKMYKLSSTKFEAK